MPIPGEQRQPEPEQDRSPDLVLALALADAADELSMATFTGSALAFESKGDGSPVTETDRAIERRLRQAVAEQHPTDGFLGEEVGRTDPSASPSRCWIVDGIDGTVVFVAGDTGWGTEIALEVDGVVTVGVSTSPALGRRWWASRGAGAWTAARRPDGGFERASRLRVSERSSLDGSSLDGSSCSAIPPVEVLDGEARALAERLTAVSTYVTPNEHAALFVAAGTVDIGLQIDGGPWDFAALAVIVEEAGGSFSRTDGAWDIHRGGPVLYTNGHLHAAALARFAP